MGFLAESTIILLRIVFEQKYEEKGGKGVSLEFPFNYFGLASCCFDVGRWKMQRKIQTNKKNIITYYKSIRVSTYLFW